LLVSITAKVKAMIICLFCDWQASLTSLSWAHRISIGGDWEKLTWSGRREDYILRI